MGAAGRIEAERRRQQQVTPTVEEIAEVRAEFERSLSNEATSTTPGVKLPGLDPDLMVRRRSRPNVFKHRPGAVHEPAERRRHTLPTGQSFEERRREPLSRQAEPTTDKAYRQRFGSYAGSRRGGAHDLPRCRRRRTRSRQQQHGAHGAIRWRGRGRRRAVPGPCAGDTGTARPVVIRRAYRHALAGDTEMQSSDPRPTIGVELRRETATFHIPVSEAALPEALKKLTGDALHIENETPAAPQLEISSATTLPAITAAETQAILLSDESGPQEFDGADFEPPRVLRRMVE